MHEMPVDASQNEAAKLLKDPFKPISRAEFADHMNRHQRRAEIAEGRHADRPVHTVLTMGGPKKIGRNQRCPCGSGRKYKKCCGIGA